MNGVRQGSIKGERRHRPYSTVARRPGNTLPLLLVWALLLCHGVLGFMHEVPHGCEGTHHMLMASPAGGHDADHAGERGMEAPKCGHMLAAYFAILLGLVGAAFLWRLLGNLGRLRRIVLGSHRSFDLSRFAHLPRGPTLPILQVYRL